MFDALPADVQSALLSALGFALADVALALVLVLLTGAVLALIFLPALLLLGLDLLAKAARLLPNWRIFNEPAQGGLLRRLSIQGWVAVSMGAFVLVTLLAHTLVPR